MLVAGLLLIPLSAVISSVFTPKFNMPLFFLSQFCGELLLILALAGALSTKITAQLGRALPWFQLAVYGFYLTAAVNGLLK